MNLRHRVAIQSLVPVQDDTTGNITDTWSTFATVWAEIRPLNAREFIAAAAAQSKVTEMVTIRYIAGVKQSMRILHRAQILNVEGVLPDQKSGIEYLTLPVSEVQSG